MLGEYYINSGFYWGSTTGIYCAILEGEGSRWMGMRSRAPPVADAARRSTRSGRKNRASEQREDFFGHRKAVGANAPAATLGAYLCAVRTMLLHRSYPALQATERGSSRGNLSPLTVFWFLLYAQKERLRGERCLLCLCKRLRAAEGKMKFGIKGVAVRGCGTIFFREGIPPAGGKNWPRRASTIYGMFIDRGGAA